MLCLPDAWIWDSWVVDDGERLPSVLPPGPASTGRSETATRKPPPSVTRRLRDLTDWDIPRPMPCSRRPTAGTIWRCGPARWRAETTASGAFTTQPCPPRDTACSTSASGSRSQTIIRTWRRVGTSPVLQADPRWYKTLDGRGPAQRNWRGPFVFADPDGNGWHMLVAAPATRTHHGLSEGRVAHARGHDMRNWELVDCRLRGRRASDRSRCRRYGDRRAAAVFVHLLPARAEGHQQAGGRYCTWTVTGGSVVGPWGPASGSAVRQRADPLRGAARPSARRELGLSSVSATRSPGDTVLPYRGSDPGGVVRRCPRRAVGRDDRWLARTSPTRLVTEFDPRAHHELAAEDAEAFIVGLIRILPDAVRTLDELYGMRTDTSDLVRTLVSDALRMRSRATRRCAGSTARGWTPRRGFRHARMIGYVCYADRFAGRCAGRALPPGLPRRVSASATCT